MQKLSFIIAEKSYIVRAGLMKIINSFQEINVLKEIDELKSVIKNVNNLNPDFLIINIKFLEDAHEDIRKLFASNIKTKFIILVGTKRAREHFEFFNEQISIDDTKTEITKKIQALINKKIPKNELEVTEELSDREKEVLRLVAMGKTNKEIAETLYISAHTAITHRKNITNKLEIKTVAGLTVYAIINNIIDIDEAI